MVVQRALKEAGFGMRQLAETEGLSYQLVRTWANGHRTPRPENIQKIADGFTRQAERLQELARELREVAETDVGAEGDGE